MRIVRHCIGGPLDGGALSTEEHVAELRVPLPDPLKLVVHHLSEVPSPRVGRYEMIGNLWLYMGEMAA